MTGPGARDLAQAVHDAAAAKVGAQASRQAVVMTVDQGARAATVSYPDGLPGNLATHAYAGWQVPKVGDTVWVEGAEEARYISGPVSGTPGPLSVTDVAASGWGAFAGEVGAARFVSGDSYFSHDTAFFANGATAPGWVATGPVGFKAGDSYFSDETAYFANGASAPGFVAGALGFKAGRSYFTDSTAFFFNGVTAPGYNAQNGRFTSGASYFSNNEAWFNNGASAPGFDAGAAGFQAGRSYFSDSTAFFFNGVSAPGAALGAVSLHGNGLTSANKVLDMAFGHVYAGTYFTNVSERRVKRDVSPAKTGHLAAVLGAPLYHFRYEPEEVPDADPEVWRLGPMADDLPQHTKGLDPRDRVTPDLTAMLFEAWGAIAELHQLVADLTSRVDQLRPGHGPSQEAAT